MRRCSRFAPFDHEFTLGGESRTVDLAQTSSWRGHAVMIVRFFPGEQVVGDGVALAGRSVAETGRLGASSVRPRRGAGSCPRRRDVATKSSVETILTFLVRPVQALDHFAARFGAVIIGVMAVAKEELTTSGRVIPDPPASGLMAIVFANDLIHPGADRAESTEFGDVGAESGPESIIWPRLVHCAGVNCQPVIDR